MLATVMAARKVVSSHQVEFSFDRPVTAFWNQPGVFHLQERTDGDYFVWSSDEFPDAALFEIQIRSVADADFRTLKSWQAHVAQYEYLLQPHHLDSEYRLRATDSNGGESFSETVAVKAGEAQKLLLYPNPTKGNVKITGPQIESYQLKDVRGQVLISGQPSANMEVEMIISAELSRSGEGLYFLQCETSRGQEMIQIRKI